MGRGSRLEEEVGSRNTATGAPERASVAGVSEELSNGSGNDGAFHNNAFTGTLTSVVAAVTNVPEPGTLVILSSVLVVFALARRRIAMRQVTVRSVTRS